MRLLKRAVSRALELTPYTMGRRKRLEPDPFRWMAQGLIDRQTRGVMLEVGANSGQTAMRLTALFPNATVHSFEPGAEAFARLRGKTALDAARVLIPIRRAVRPSDS